VIPAVPGGKYSPENIRRRCLYDYPRFTGDIARQTRDLKDGDKVDIHLARPEKSLENKPHHATFAGCSASMIFPDHTINSVMDAPRWRGFSDHR
jgi:hypothetical protein